MRVRATAEFVPTSWSKIDIALYHMYGESFDLVDARILITVAPQSLGEGLNEESNWHQVYDDEFPTEDDKETESLIRENITTVDIPDEITS